MSPTPAVEAKNIFRHCQIVPSRSQMSLVENHGWRGGTLFGLGWEQLLSRQFPSGAEPWGSQRFCVACTLLRKSQDPGGWGWGAGHGTPAWWDHCTSFSTRLSPWLIPASKARALQSCICSPFGLNFLCSNQFPGKKAKDRPLVVLL